MRLGLAQMDLDGGDEPWYGVGGNQGDLGVVYGLVWAFGPAEMHTEHRVVVMALNKGEVNRIAAGRKDADLSALVWKKFDSLVEEGLWLKVTWVKAYTMAHLGYAP